MNDKAHMQVLADRMQVRLRHDECNDPVIQGRHGNIHADGLGYSVAVMLDTRRQWTAAKRRLRPFCELRQDGDTEGVLHVKALSVKQGVVLRDIVGVSKVPTYTPEVLQRKQESMLEARRSLTARPLPATGARLAPLM